MLLRMNDETTIFLKNVTLILKLLKYIYKLQKDADNKIGIPMLANIAECLAKIYD